MMKKFDSFYFIFIIRINAIAASLPLFFVFVFDLSIAWFLFKHVIIPFVIGFLYLIDNFIIPSIAVLEMKSKWGVLPLITQPSAINASYFLIFFEIVIGISKTPGTLIIFSEKSFKFFLRFLIMMKKYLHSNLLSQLIFFSFNYFLLCYFNSIAI